ncbi:MAG: DUF4331 family protein [Balneolaceae bacterium]|nr:DUF4331 family protein [Balneolaceae bacterium]
MKNIKLYTLLVLTSSLLLIGCGNNNNSNPPVSADTQFSQSDQVGRPAINTVFVTGGNNKNAFNTTIPGNMETAYQQSFEDRLLALNPNYTQNALGQDATTFTTLLSNDVLNVATSGVTTFFDGQNVLTGNNLSDDEIDVELLLIFGGPDGSENPGLTSDNVDSNDRQFLNTFPYLAPDHQ